MLATSLTSFQASSNLISEAITSTKSPASSCDASPRWTSNLRRNKFSSHSNLSKLFSLLFWNCTIFLFSLPPPWTSIEDENDVLRKCQENGSWKSARWNLKQTFYSATSVGMRMNRVDFDESIGSWIAWFADNLIARLPSYSLAFRRKNDALSVTGWLFWRVSWCVIDSMFASLRRVLLGRDWRRRLPPLTAECRGDKSDSSSLGSRIDTRVGFTTTFGGSDISNSKLSDSSFPREI